VRTGSGDPAVVEDDHSIDIDDGRKPMRDDYRGRSVIEPAQRFMNQGFAFRVERAGGFIEDQDARICGVRAGSLATRNVEVGEWRRSPVSHG